MEGLGDELRAAKQNPVIIPKVSKKIIDDYKASEDFLCEVVEGSTDGFSKGFDLCQSQVQSFFLDFDINQLKDFSDNDDDDAEAEVKAEVGGTLEIMEEVAEAEVKVEGVLEVMGEVAGEVAAASLLMIPPPSRQRPEELPARPRPPPGGVADRPRAVRLGQPRRAAIRPRRGGRQAAGDRGAGSQGRPRGRR